ncbi:hypothetical protein OFN12_27575, partial [Escherichia coli]|nr:hypothetical protein [Escherichia coli]
KSTKINTESTKNPALRFFASQLLWYKHTTIYKWKYHTYPTETLLKKSYLTDQSKTGQEF